MNINQQLMFLAILIVLVIIVAYTRSFEDGVPSCNGYIINVYLYLLLGLLITAFTVLFIAKRNYPITYTKAWIAVIIGIVVLFGLYSTQPQQTLLNYSLWILFLITSAVVVYLFWRYSSFQGTIRNTLIAVFLLVLTLTTIAFIKPDWIQFNAVTLTTLLLTSVLLAWLIPSGRKIWTAFLVFLFMALVLYDTKALRYKAERCTIPDYPRDSLGLFLDIVGLFGNIGSLRTVQHKRPAVF